MEGESPDQGTAPEDMFVLRGGDLTGPSREKNLRDVHEAYDVWGICCAAEPGKTPHEIASYGKFGSKRMMTGVAGELDKAGFKVTKEPGHDWPNALIVFANEPEAEDWDDLRAVMLRRPIEDNPSYKGPK